MERVMIVSSNHKFGVMLSELILSLFSPEITIVQSGSEARRAHLHLEFDMVIINAPLSDEFGHELAMRIAEDSMTGVLLLAKAEVADSVSMKVEDNGIYVLGKPFGRNAFFSAYKLIRASRRRMTGLKKENQKLQEKILEMKVVNRAKCLLIEMGKFKENEAHSYLEQEAMHRRISKKELAQQIVREYTRAEPS